MQHLRSAWAFNTYILRPNLNVILSVISGDKMLEDQMSCSTHGGCETYECSVLKQWSFLLGRHRHGAKDIRKMKNKVIKYEVVTWVNFE